MKKTLSIISGCIFAVAVIFNLFSCKVKESSPPTVAFYQVAGYVSADTTLYRHTIFPIWVVASKDGVGDLVETGTITRSINGGPDSTLQTMNFVMSQFSYIYSYKAGDSGDVTKYTFTFGNEKGVTGSNSIVITAN